MHQRVPTKVWRVIPAALLLGSLSVAGQAASRTVHADETVPDSLFCLKNPDASSCPSYEGLSSGAYMGKVGPISTDSTEPNNPQPGYHDHGRGGNSFVNDPCLDPAAPNRARTTQSETTIKSFGKYMVAGFNNSAGFYDNREGLSGYAYSVNGGNTWVDGRGLPPVVPGAGFLTPGHDQYEGDPVLAVDKSPRTFVVNGQQITQPAGAFYYASIYHDAAGYDTLSVNRGTFQSTPPTGPESVANTRCLNDPTQQGVPNTKNLPSERIVWSPPSEVVQEQSTPGDFLDKEWLTINPATGELYITYTRFGVDGSTPLELVRSKDGGRTWEGPFVIVPNLDDTFNQATQPIVTGTGRIVVTWYSRQFSLTTGAEIADKIEYAYSDTDGTTFSPTQRVSLVNPQGEPPGYNRRRPNILNAPYITARGTDVYITYFSGKPGSPQLPGTIPGARPSDIFLSASHNNGTTFGPPVKVNDDSGTTSHVFPTTQVNKNGNVYVGWLDRRNDPVVTNSNGSYASGNVLTDAWAAVSKDGGATFSPNREQTDVATSWYVRADARPNFGDYNSSDLLNDNQFLMIWADGRFPPPAPAPQAATPDTMFTIANGLGN